MPLTLITGPANSAKAGAILERVRAVAARAPLLVVPGAADADSYRRELVASGAVYGVRPVVFAGLLDVIAARAGITAPAAGELARLQVAAAATAATELDVLAESARTPGFPQGLARFADELCEQRIAPQRLRAALAAWAGDDARRRAYGSELSALIAADAQIARRSGLITAPARVTAALDALRERPALWGDTPVLLYGFDDLGTLQLDVVESLAGPVGADVTLALTYEPGRDAFAAGAALYGRLSAIAAGEQRLPASRDHYVPGSSVALHHIERHLFEDGAPRCEVADGVRALRGGDQRAELELAACEIAGRIAAGEAPESIAVVHRAVAGLTGLVRQVFADAGVPIALREQVVVRRTRIGRGVLALLRLALGSGHSDDLVRYLRLPGVLERPELADELEERLRVSGISDGDQALELWAGAHWELDAVGRLRAAAERGPGALCEALERRLWRLLSGSDRGLAPVFAGRDGIEPRAAAALLGALAELAALPVALQPDGRRLEHLLGELTVAIGERPGAGLVTVTEPQRLRARRVQRLYCLGLNEGVFPATVRPEPFLGDDDRRELAHASGIVLRLHEDAADVERLFFYAELSRPEIELVVGWHETGDDGRESVRSSFADELCALLPESWEQRARFRPLAAVGWPPEHAPTEREALRYAAATGPRQPEPPLGRPADPAVLDELSQRVRFSASALEQWIACPVRWFVERQLRPGALAPDAEALVRGDIAHKVLERVIGELAGRPGGVAAQPLAARRELVATALAEATEKRTISVDPYRLRVELRRLEIDLLAYLEWLARSPSSFRPQRLELEFGGPDDELPAATLGGEFTISGRIDRIDVDPGGQEAIIYDYKGRSDPPLHNHWADQGRLQLQLYLRAIEELLELRGVGAFYQPIGRGKGLRARGIVQADVDTGFTPAKGDLLGDDEFAALLDDAAARALVAAVELRSGALEPRPDSCTRDGGCAHPVICRCDP